MVDDATRAKVLEHYEKGQGSIQDIARVYLLSVEQVLDILNQTDLLEVQATGDLIDQEEAGSNATINYQGETFRPRFSLD